MTRWQRQSGFTLVEVLVVIAITGMVSVLVLQMLTIVLRGADGVSRVQGEMSMESMRNSWFRDSIAVMVASLDEEFAFRGSERAVSGFTMAPLIGQSGELTQVTWSLESTGEGQHL